MNFTLTYDGELKSNGNAEHKHEIRKNFHLQLLKLWEFTPFEELKTPSDSLTTKTGSYRFFPLVSQNREEIAHLDILMLRPEFGPGNIVGQGGDIDNRLKTLFDSLRLPRVENEIPAKYQTPDANENPFFCLVEDDILISKLSVATDRLLEPFNSSSHVKLVIQVQIKKVPLIGANMIIRVC